MSNSSFQDKYQTESVFIFVSKTESGSKSEGTCFAVSDSLVLTAKHLVEGKQSFTCFKTYEDLLCGKGIILQEFYKGDDLDYVFLKAPEQSFSKYINLGIIQLEKDDTIESYGFTAEKAEHASPLDSTVVQVFSFGSPVGFSYELTLSNTISDYGGMSGSPVLLNHTAIGILVYQQGMNTLYAVSVEHIWQKIQQDIEQSKQNLLTDKKTEAQSSLSKLLCNSIGIRSISFVSNIQALFALLLFMNRPSPCLPGWPISKLVLQPSSHKKISDFIVLVKNIRTLKEAKLYVHVNQDVFLEGNEGAFKDWLSTAWKTLNNPNIFDHNIDSLALISLPSNTRFASYIKALIDASKNSINDVSFIEKLHSEDGGSNELGECFQDLRAHLNIQNSEEELSEHQFWHFLRSIHLLTYGSEDIEDFKLSLFQSLGPLSAKLDLTLIWTQMLFWVQSESNLQGMISPETLPTKIKNLLNTPERALWIANVIKLEEHSEFIINNIKLSIAGFHVKRDIVLENSLHSAQNSTFLFVSGKRGAGKSSVVRGLSEHYLKSCKYPLYYFRTEDLDHSNLDQVFNSLGLSITFQDLVRGTALTSKAFIVLESIEKLLELKNKAAFNDLLQIVKNNSAWKIIASGREYSYQQIVFNYLEPAEVNSSLVLVNDFNEAEFDQLCSYSEHLKLISTNASLKKLLRNPYLADLAHRVSVTGAKFSNSDGEREFQEAIWSNIIEKNVERANGLPIKRKNTFIEIALLRAKLMVYGISEKEFDEEVIQKLHEDNLILRNAGTLTLSHDVLEDWALERYIEESYHQLSNDILTFLGQVGHEPAMSRAYRLWLNRKIILEDEVTGFIVALLNEKDILKVWQHETLNAILNGNDPYIHLNQLKEVLCKNKFSLLKRACFVLRVSGMVPDYETIKRINTFCLMPYGPGWDAIVRFLFELKDQLTVDMVPHVSEVINVWCQKVQMADNLPQYSREVGLLSLQTLELVKNSYSSRNDSSRKQLLQAIIKLAAGINEELQKLLEEEVFITTDRRKRLRFVDDFSKLALMKIDGIYLCITHPETVVKLAFHEWTISEIDEDDEENGLPFKIPKMHRDVETDFGLKIRDFEFERTSDSQGPFKNLLKFHPRIGIDCILKLLNFAAKNYMSSDLDNSREISTIEIQLDDNKVVKQYCSQRLWCGFTGHVVLPKVLQVALRALQNWLVEYYEKVEDSTEYEWVFNYILVNSNSVMTTAILATIAITYPQKLGKSVLPLLRIPEFLQLDHERFMYQKLNSVDGAWGQKNLEDLLLLLQFSELREAALEIVDEIKERSPKSESWRFRLIRIDSRHYSQEIEVDTNRVQLTPEIVEQDLIEIQNQSIENQTILIRLNNLYSWAKSNWSKSSDSNNQFEDIKDALVEAQDLLRITQSGQNSVAIIMPFTTGIIKTAAVFLRDHSDVLNDEEVFWCVKVIIDSLNSVHDDHDSIMLESEEDFTGEFTCGAVLPMLFNFAQTRNHAKKAIANALTHRSGKVRSGAAYGLREHLWKIDPDFVQTCIFGTIEYARIFRLDEVELTQQIQKTSKNSNWLAGLLSRALGYIKSKSPKKVDKNNEIEEYYNAIGKAIDDLVEKILQSKLTFSEQDITSINPETHSFWHLQTSFLIIPNESNNSIHKTLAYKLLSLYTLARSKKGKSRDEDFRDLQADYKMYSKFVHRFADYFLSLSESQRVLFHEPLINSCETSPKIIKQFLLYIGFVAEKADQKLDKTDRSIYWEVWRLFANKIQSLAINFNELDSDDVDTEGIRGLIRSMLQADIPWQKVDFESQWISSGKNNILDFAKAAGKNVDVFEALVSLMYHFPAVFFSDGLVILAQIHRDNFESKLLDGRNTVYYLERSIQRFLQISETGPLSKNIHESCLILLDALVEKASSIAYYLRENIIHSRRISNPH